MSSLLLFLKIGTKFADGSFRLKVDNRTCMLPVKVTIKI